jgi:hypothetical protein
MSLAELANLRDVKTLGHHILAVGFAYDTPIERPEERIRYETGHILSNSTGRPAFHLLQGSGTKRRANSAPASWIAFIVADV